ncbi:V-type ATP synthase subunit I [Sedimenticola hydrogenitrophicus]|uniref:V-type ATP synthase subunit I n=1 Tax=Sedimenticola hydrogenitrophicus TaxID=2967975 RepID=UPI0023B0014F
MFRPLPMKQVLIQLLADDLPLAALTLAELGMFSPGGGDDFSEQFPDVPGTRYRELYHQACTRLQKIESHITLRPLGPLAHTRVIGEQELATTNDWLGEVWERCSSFEEHFRRLTDEEHMLGQLEQTLDNFAALNFDLSRLRGERLFLDLHIGMLPSVNVPKLREAIALADYLLFNYMENTDHTHVIILGPKGAREQELRSVLDTAGFHALEIPPELDDEPQRIQGDLRQRRDALANERATRRQAMQTCGDELRTQLEQSRDRLIMAEPFVAMEDAARNRGQLGIISGWIPERELKRTESALRRRLDGPFRITATTPPRTRHRDVPTYLPVNWLTRAFSTLVKQYGVPRYGEINPTPIFAVSFIAMFGMMFGDAGHGGVIILAAWLGRKRLKSFTPFAICAGLSTSLFGLLYGSLFGYEHLFQAVWIPPLSDPLYMLRMALFWGIGFMVIMSLLYIHNQLVSGEISHALFATNGVVSVTLYLSVLTGIYRFVNTGQFGLLPAGLSLAALLALLAFKLIETQAPPGERMLVAGIETFETLTGYISNTLSFLRVAAFSLNHVALAIAVFTLADMMEGTGHWLMVIGGNLFILILEGAIVTIQALRLEYYEGFSRFFSGDGQEFKPLTLSLQGVK